MKGIAFCHYDQSHVLLRKNAISALKMISRNSNVGFQEILANESDTLIMEMLSQRGEPFNPNECLYFSAANVIFQIAFGKDCDLRQNSDISWAVRNTMTLNNFAAPFNPLNMFPWLRFVLPRKMNTYALYQEYANRSANALIQKQTGMIETHDEHEMRHLVDALVAISKGNTWHGKKVTKEMIFSVVADLIGAGFDTTASSLKWGILFLASHHEVQERVQKEIDEIVGQHRKPSVLDRKNLQYSEAVVLEILRMAPILPLALPHSACTKTKLLGFTIPENTIVLVNLLSSNLDRQLWRSPTEFKPERFLDQDGNIDNKIADNVMSFGTGRRRCIGEQLARSNIFVFLTSLLQRCKIIQPEDEEYDFEGKLTLTYVPNTFKIKVRERT